MRVLVVDHDEETRADLVGVLRANGAHVVAAADGYLALAELAGGRFDLLVTDLLMPGVSGIELMVKLGQRGMSLPTLVVTGAGPGPLVDQAYQAGAAQVIEKPWTESELMQAVADVASASPHLAPLAGV